MDCLFSDSTTILAKHEKLKQYSLLGWVRGRWGRDNLAASVVSRVLGGQAASLESPETSGALSPLLEVVDNLEAEEREMKVARERSAGQDNLNLKDSSHPLVHTNSEAGRQLATFLVVF